MEGKQEPGRRKGPGGPIRGELHQEFQENVCHCVDRTTTQAFQSTETLAFKFGGGV